MSKIVFDGLPKDQQDMIMSIGASPETFGTEGAKSDDIEVEKIFAKAGAKPFYAFTAGVVVNVILGYILSTQVFVDFWVKLGQQ